MPTRPHTDELTKFNLGRVWSFWKTNGFGALMRHGRFVILKRLHFSMWDRRFEHLEKIATRGFVATHDLAPSGALHLQQANEYAPSPRLVVHWLLNSLNTDLSRSSFVDYGSGRGRVLLTAAEKPFDAVRGVEFSKQLHEEAAINIANYPADHLACRDIQSVYGDALEFDPPRGDCVLYFYNPFDANLLSRVVRQALDVIVSRGDRATLIYANPVHGQVMADEPRLMERKLSLLLRFKLRFLSPCDARIFELIGD